MENRQEVYEAPTLREAGDFAEGTFGWPFGYRRDGGLPPYWLYPYGE
ncbi:lasso RiPP family leader peptide-containing protein [Streptomyces achromogenes]